MTRAPFVMGKSETAFTRQVELQDTTMGWRFINPALRAAYGVDTMPETAENVASAFAVSRADQDAFALRSQQRTKAAQDAGYFAEEISPVTIAGPKAEVTIAIDEHPRSDTTLAGLQRLKGLFGKAGTVTAGNASGINDGAAALVLASEAAAKKNGLTPRARIVATATAGIEPRIMGMGPVPAVKKLLAKTGMALSRIDLLELNEAFAS